MAENARYALQDGSGGRNSKRFNLGFVENIGIRIAAEELKDVPTLPGSLDDSLKALENDHDFLLKGDVFSQQLIDRWITYKREREINPLRMRPHPLEFSLYYDI